MYFLKLLESQSKHTKIHIDSFFFVLVVKYYIEVHTSEAEMTAGTNANVFITLYGSQSDSGRRHLIHSREARKRFQPGQVFFFLLK